MKTEKMKVIKNTLIAKDTYELVLKPEEMTEIKPGQFINMQLTGFMLRRPFSVASVNESTYTILYKVVGKGTKMLSSVRESSLLDILHPLGSGFDMSNSSDEVLILGGGIGIAPLYEVAKLARLNNSKVKVVLGFESKEYVYYTKEFEALGCEVFVSTSDGSYGTKGNVLDVVKEHNITETFVYACGPLPMLKAISEVYTEGFISLEERMACGIGACMSCVCKDKQVDEMYYRICKEGPVFEIGKVSL